MPPGRLTSKRRSRNNPARNERATSVFASRTVLGATTQPTGRAPRLGVALVAACLLAGLTAALWPGGADGAKPKAVVLGVTSTTPAPACPGSPCEAVGSVSGFQTVAGATKKPFEVPFDGHLVAWSLTMSAPKSSQESFFNSFYDSPPEARVGVVKQTNVGKSPPRYKLLRETPTVVLTPFLGTTVTFTLDNPLVVRQGNTIILTIPTWAPVFAVGLSDGSSWRASRQTGKCTKTDDIKQSHPQQKVGSEKQYGCYYKTARLLYNATLIKG